MQNHSPARTPLEIDAVEPPGGAAISHVASVYKRYPGEEVCFYTHLAVESIQPGLRLTVQLSGGFELIDYSPLNDSAIYSINVTDQPEGPVVQWRLCDGYPLPLQIEFITRARVRPLDQDIVLLSQVVLRDGTGQPISEESAHVTVSTQSRLMAYLPEIYHDNSLMSRLLMMFDSFLEPIDRQIAQPEVYYDPSLAPASFLPWLASWIGLPMDENLPEKRSRRLLGSAFALYQRYGTKQALENFLCLYTGGEVEIIEHRTQNLVLGAGTHLGPTVALGKHNFPHTFTVILKVTRPAVLSLFGENQVNPERLYRRRIESIIEAQKPAHTAFSLNLQIIDTNPAPDAVPERTLL